jgi:hypothetical protein
LVRWRFRFGALAFPLPDQRKDAKDAKQKQSLLPAFGRRETICLVIEILGTRPSFWGTRVIGEAESFLCFASSRLGDLCVDLGAQPQRRTSARHFRASLPRVTSARLFGDAHEARP